MSHLHDICKSSGKTKRRQSISAPTMEIFYVLKFGDFVDWS